MISVTGPKSLDARFPGQWFQFEAGLHANWHRTYDPSLGRYLEADPLGFPDGPNRYAYVGSSPLMYVDPEGRNAILVGAITMAATALVASIWAEPANAPGTGDKIEPPAPLAPYAAGALAGLSMSSGLFCAFGREIEFGPNFRLAPGGNRRAEKWYGKLPHYHRRVTGGERGNSKHGQGIKRHRPWQKKSSDQSFWDRF